ncbi:hypothetical protein N752_10680 [Desulforamulus aquiferis]|nr:hypothetical protein N752_10680 [Desulforamulus aquiferis]
MLVGSWFLHQRTDMNATLMGKGALPYKAD